MNRLDKLMNDHQYEWRRTNVTTPEHGFQNDLQRPWILPVGEWEQGLWHELRTTGSWPLVEYLKAAQVQRHTGSHNLKSSWISGVNTYFPFGQTAEGRALLGSFLAASVDSRIETVDRVELEYAEDGVLSPESLLGEEGGNRGSNQTSPDLAFLVNEGKGLLLVENKLTEHSFYACSARRTHGSTRHPANPDVGRCENPLVVASDPCAQCHQEAWGRRYWTRLRDAVDTTALETLTCCPAARAGYQLFRQQALAEGMARQGQYEFVISCVALDERNSTLARCLKSTGLKDVRQWGSLLGGESSFAVFTHQQWLQWVRTHDMDGEWGDWIHWVEERYAYERPY